MERPLKTNPEAELIRQQIQQLKEELEKLDLRHRALDISVQFFEDSHGTIFAMNRVAQEMLDIKEQISRLEAEL